jgi:hypothetical protein
MKRRTEMRITLLLDMIILAALLVTSASASLENAGKFQLHPLPSLVDRLHHELSANIGTYTMNCNCSREKTVITQAGPRPSENVHRVSPTSGIGIALDEKGVPSYRNPVTISQTAMRYYLQYQGGNESARGFSSTAPTGLSKMLSRGTTIPSGSTIFHLLHMVFPYLGYLAWPKELEFRRYYSRIISRKTTNI